MTPPPFPLGNGLCIVARTPEQERIIQDLHDAANHCVPTLQALLEMIPHDDPIAA